MVWLHALSNYIKATPARFAKKPIAIRGRLSVRHKKCSFSQRVLKNILRFRRLAVMRKQKRYSCGKFCAATLTMGSREFARRKYLQQGTNLPGWTKAGSLQVAS